MGLGMDLGNRAARLLRERVAGVRRDLSMVLGKKAPPTIHRPPRRPMESPARMPSVMTLREARVLHMVHETDRATTIVFEPTDGAGLSFRAGQFITVDVVVGGRTVRRAYSLSVAPDAEHPAFTVKRIAGGRVSTHFTSECHVGDVFHFLGPSGSFVHDGDGTRPLVCIVGGSGITPVMGLLTDTLRRHPSVHARLLFGNTRAKDVMFAARLASLAEETGRLHITHALEDAPPDFTGIRGALTEEAVRAHLEREKPPENALYYLCGPAPMREGARRALAGLGVVPSSIHEEVFVRPEAHTETAAQSLTVRHRRGADFTVAMAPNQTILEAGLAAAAPMPFSCAMGGCGACRVRLVSGAVAMDEPNCLTNQERNDGYILACVSRAESAVTVELP